MHSCAATDPTDDAAAPFEPMAPILVKLGRWATRHFVSVLRPVGLKPRELAALVELRGGVKTQRKLGEAICLDAAQVVNLLNEMEAEKLIERRRDPADRRRHIVALAEAGRRRLDVAGAAVASVDALLMDGLNDEERTQLATLLRFVSRHGAFDDESVVFATTLAYERETD